MRYALFQCQWAVGEGHGGIETQGGELAVGGGDAAGERNHVGASLPSSLRHGGDGLAEGRLRVEPAFGGDDQRGLRDALRKVERVQYETRAGHELRLREGE